MTGLEHLAIQERITSSAGYAVYGKIQKIWVSHRTLSRNEQDLTGLLGSLADSKRLTEILGPQNKSAHDDALYEVARLLHNYVASAKSLVDHTRKTARELLEGKALGRYQEVIEREFIRDPLCCFIQDLRIYAQHRSLPDVATTFQREKDGGYRLGIKLYWDTMSSWSGWDSHAREYMRDHEGNPFLSDIISVYSAKINRVYSWIIEHFKVCNKVTLDQFWELQNELRVFYKKNGIPITEQEWRDLDKKV